MDENLRIKVLVVDDSPFVRKALLRIFESEQSIEVVGTAKNGREALDKIDSLKPDVLTLDIMMPVLDGIETLKILMKRNPLPVLVLSQFTHEGAELTLRALQLGAMDFVDKSSKGLMDFLALASEIVSKVKTIAHNKPKALVYEPRVLSGYEPRGIMDVVAIGASTGGPPALSMILQKFPRDISFGILIVQHMPKGFTASLAQRFDSICAIRVKEAEEHDRIEPGLALIAPSGIHMKVAGSPSPLNKSVLREVTLDMEPRELVHRPSVDVLFQSVAETFGKRSLGVILTGMGSDGAKGLKALRQSGGLTLAQDEATSVIFGMPKVAINSGAVDKIVPLTGMAEEIMRNV